ncbi:MAG: hypothetical protein PHW69_05005 [Elusimicrobiaceae bacterium]|nr:hypothetical protein [Elusimicrobiaceae bacterium]
MKLIFPLLALLACGGCALPGGAVKPENGMVFAAAYANFQARLTWSEYTGPGFSAYRLVKSSSDRNPACAAAPVIMTEHDSTVKTFTDSSLETGEYYYRLCVDKTDGTTLQSEVERVFVKYGAFEQDVPGPSAF